MLAGLSAWLSQCKATRKQKHKGNLTRYCQEGISREKTREKLRECLSTAIRGCCWTWRTRLSLTASRKWSWPTSVTERLSSVFIFPSTIFSSTCNLTSMLYLSLCSVFSFGCQNNVFTTSTIVGCDFIQAFKKNLGEHGWLQNYSKNGHVGVVLQALKPQPSATLWTVSLFTDGRRLMLQSLQYHTCILTRHGPGRVLSVGGR